jgi:hypothetical protein
MHPYMKKTILFNVLSHKSLKKIVFFIGMLLISVHGAIGQTNPGVLKGIVYDFHRNTVLSNVTVKNLETGEEVVTKADGEFTIPVKINGLLEVENYGYRTDTLVIIDYSIKRIYMTHLMETIMLDAVTIPRLSDRQLDEQIRKAELEGESVESSIQRGGLRLSPSRIFGQGGRQARAHFKLLLEEKDKRVINNRFSESRIKEYLPLEGEELSLYMAIYRPTLEFAKDSNDQTFMLYILDSYKKFKELTPAQKDAYRLQFDKESIPERFQ